MEESPPSRFALRRVAFAFHHPTLAHFLGTSGGGHARHSAKREGESQLPDLAWYRQFSCEENTDFASDDQEEFGLIWHYS